MEKKLDQPATTADPDSISFFFENQMTQNYKTEEKKLQELFTKHVVPVADSVGVKLLIYYKQKKLSSLFIRNKECRANEKCNRHHVVYEYTCNEEGCNAPKYIGYTTCTLYERFAQHASIKKHMSEVHGVARIGRRALLESVTVLCSISDRRRLIMTEAMMIKQNKPQLNSQEEGSTRLLKIFKH